MVSLPSPPSFPWTSALPSPSVLRGVLRPPRPDFSAALRSFPRPSLPSPVAVASRLGSFLRPSADTVDATLAVAALGTGIGIVATGAYTAANVVLPLALLRGFFESLTP